MPQITLMDIHLLPVTGKCLFLLLMQWLLMYCNMTDLSVYIYLTWHISLCIASPFGQWLNCADQMCIPWFISILETNKDTINIVLEVYSESKYENGD